ncbi:hypothetical protein H4R19_000812 [Coemansia spiralis]|nr:hypothetical protein H4R19_000812 [Coemansia spiralis]
MATHIQNSIKYTDDIVLKIGLWYIYASLVGVERASELEYYMSGAGMFDWYQLSPIAPVNGTDSYELVHTPGSGMGQVSGVGFTNGVFYMSENLRDAIRR